MGFLYSHTYSFIHFYLHHKLVVYILQYNNCGLMISENNYKIYLLMYSRVILYIIFFQYFQVMCAVSLIKMHLCIVVYCLFKVDGPQGPLNIASTTNVFVISVMSYQI